MFASLFIFTIVCYAITSILINSRLFKFIKNMSDIGLLNKFLRCPLCIGFHVGYIVFLLFGLAGLPITVFGVGIISYFLAACYSSGLTYLLYVIVDDDGIRIS